MHLTTTGGLSGLMQTWYDRKFLDRARKAQVFMKDAQKRSIPMNSGKTVTWNRFAVPALATTALTEGTNPSAVDNSTTTVSATVAEYGYVQSVSSLFKMTSLDENLNEHVDVLGQHAGETLDKLVNTEVASNATVQLANGRAGLVNIVAGDNLTGAEIRKAARTLKTQSAMRFDDGFYHGIIQPFTEYDLFGNSEWQNSRQYVDPSEMQEGYAGKLYGVKFMMSNNSSSESSTVTVYHNFIYGKNAYGVVDIAGTMGPKIIVKNPGEQDTSNPLNMFSTVGWKSPFATKVLNANWIINVKTAATA